jgi:hypothetical protein
MVFIYNVFSSIDSWPVHLLSEVWYVLLRPLLPELEGQDVEASFREDTSSSSGWTGQAFLRDLARQFKTEPNETNETVAFCFEITEHTIDTVSTDEMRTPLYCWRIKISKSNNKRPRHILWTKTLKLMTGKLYFLMSAEMWFSLL